MANMRPVAKMESGEPSLRLAVLIDADNAQAAVIEGLLAEIARFGEATVRRIYGDFTSSNSAQWKKVLQKHAIKPVQQFAYTTGKNATDSSLIIDAMDLLYTRRFDGFCLVTSDSDFTGLALRIREEGLTVLGFGEQKTPDAFRNACHKFIFTEVLRPVPRITARKPAQSTQGGRKTYARKSTASVEPADPAELIETAATSAPSASDFPREFFLEALEQAGDDSGWANLGALGTYLTKLQPDFDARLYGFKKLSDLIRARHDVFVIEERTAPGSTRKDIYVRAREDEAPPKPTVKAPARQIRSRRRST
ncbi:MAG: NYN domain-containing protein [Candidatus Sericytochromatia bacterium]